MESSSFYRRGSSVTSSLISDDIEASVSGHFVTPPVTPQSHHSRVHFPSSPYGIRDGHSFRLEQKLDRVLQSFEDYKKKSDDDNALLRRELATFREEVGLLKKDQDETATSSPKDKKVPSHLSVSFIVVVLKHFLTLFPQLCVKKLHENADAAYAFDGTQPYVYP